MLIDDDSITNFLNELLLKEMDISEELIITADGQKALDVIYNRCVLKGECPDLILLDVNMPVVNGFEFLKRYNEMMFDNKQSVVIVMLSTSLNPRDKEKAEALNVSDYLTKPLSKDRINELLEKYFN